MIFFLVLFISFFFCNNFNQTKNNNYLNDKLTTDICVTSTHLIDRQTDTLQPVNCYNTIRGPRFLDNRKDAIPCTNENGRTNKQTKINEHGTKQNKNDNSPLIIVTSS